MQTFTIRCFDTVNNDTLPKLDEIRFKMTTNTFDTRQHFGVEYVELATVRTNKVNMYSASTDGTNYGHSTDITPNVLTNLYFDESDGYIFLGNYNNLRRLDLYGSQTEKPLFEIDLAQLRGCSSMDSLFMETPYKNVSKGDLSDLPNISNFWRLSLIGENITGNTSVLSNSVELFDLRLWATSIEGKLSDLSKCIKLTRISSTSSAIEGDWEDMCDGMVANGRTSGRMRIEVKGHGDFYVNFANGSWSVEE